MVMLLRCGYNRGVISFRVDGLPVPQGSMRVFNGHVVHNKGAELAVWRSAIAIEARRAGCTPEPGAVKLDLLFSMPKPKTVKRLHPTVAPDLDKLIRAVLDSMTAVAYLDDGQVTEINAIKIYGQAPFLEVGLWRS
jgi:crossover junction endodeoxyribonuclease RusA